MILQSRTVCSWFLPSPCLFIGPQSYQSLTSATSAASALRLSSVSLSALFAQLEAMMQAGLQDRKLLYRRHCVVAGHDTDGLMEALDFPDGACLWVTLLQFSDVAFVSASVVFDLTGNTALAAAIWVDHVMLDIGAVSQIMVNLFSNAQKVTIDGDCNCCACD